MNFLIGIILGIVIATIGVTGAARIADKGVNAIKRQSVEINEALK